MKSKQLFNILLATMMAILSGCGTTQQNQPDDPNTNNTVTPQPEQRINELEQQVNKSFNL